MIPEVAAPRTRVHSLDAFRGLTILLMVFVIAVAAGDYRHLPQEGSWFGSLSVSTWDHAEVGWDRFAEARRSDGVSEEVLRHLPEAQLRNIGLTATDLVAPFFVFIVGMAIPLSRAGRNREWWSHVMKRTVTLVLAGVVYISLILGLSWWWGILQAIGVAYFMGAALDRAPVPWRWWLIGGVLLFHGLMSYAVPWWLHFGDTSEPFWTISQLHGSWQRPLTLHCRPWVSISYGAMTMIGVQLGTVLARGVRQDIIRHAAWIGAASCAVGFVIHEVGLHTDMPGLCFNKPDVTASYALMASGLGAFTFLPLYYVMDVRGISRWAYPLKEMGKNALLAYFLQIIMRLVFRALHIEPLFAGASNDMLVQWSQMIDADWWRSLILDKTGYNGMFWGALWTGCLFSIVVWCNKRGIVWKL